MFLQVVEEVAAHPADHRAAGDLRAGRKCGRGRYRRRAGGDLQDGEPQPPELHRALSGGGDRRGRHSARRLHHGRAADCGDEFAVFRDAVTPKTAHLVKGVVEGVGGYGNAFGVPTVGGEVRFHRSYNGNCLVNAFAAGLADTDKIFYSVASGVGMPVVYLGAKTGPRRGWRGDDGKRRVRRHHRGKAPDGAGRRSLHRKAAAGGVSGADGVGCGDFHSGHGGGGADLFGGRDGRQGRPGDQAAA